MRFDELPIVYTTEDKVRDIEVDMQRGVSNPRYLEYTQHARHEWLKTLGLDLDRTMPVVMEAHAFYKKFLTAGDRYRVDLTVYRERLGYHFLSRITNIGSGQNSFEADQLIVFFTDWRPIRQDIVAEALISTGQPVPYPVASKRRGTEE